MWFLFRRETVLSPKAPVYNQPHVSFPRRMWRGLDRIGRLPMVVPTLLLFIFFLAICNAYLFFQWWERNYPRPPLGILTGELLKGFDRYSPDENHSEKVLAEVFGPAVLPHVPCTEAGCQWLRMEIQGMAVGQNGAACDNFYSHVCDGHMGNPASLAQRAAEDLMDAIVDHLLREETSRAPEHLRMLRKCVDGDEEARKFALACDFSPHIGDSDLCPDHYPLLPRTVAESALKGYSAKKPLELISQIESFLEELNTSVSLERENRKEGHIVSTERAHTICRWLADSARCHFQELFRNRSGYDVTKRYQSVWNKLFFAPLTFGQEAVTFWELFGGGDAARKRACAQIHEVLFIKEHVEAATAVLDKLTGGVHESIAQLMDDAQYVLSQRVPYWLSRHEEGESPSLQETRRPAYLQQLQAVRVKLLGIGDLLASGHMSSIYSWKVSYDRARNLLIVPYGLVALMAKGAEGTEPVMTALLSAPLVRALLPRPNGPYSWKDAHDQHLAYVTECFRSVHNDTLGVYGDATVLTELIYESALLGPLFDLYRKALIEGFDSTVYLSERYDNWQLFYVIWTMSHCGDRRGGDVVNAALRNSVRFMRSFDCGMKDYMFSKRKCNFWVYW